ncbi:MAG: FecR domain-containing protein [Bradyrhizobiaceae bacterium]|nr:FecR domain-containing protein [Bradyrhizobiaceae bacterium]
MQRAFFLIVFTALALFAFSDRASAQRAPADESPIGKVIAVEGTATIEHVVAVVVVAGGQSNAKVGDLVYRGDVVQTGADSKLSLVFADDTALNIFSNARMELTEFVYNPSSTLNSSLFNLAKGTFTFVGGKMAQRGRMRVDTPGATMGIRGTTSHVVVGEDGSVKFSTLIEVKQ